MARLLVTGASGFLGRACLAALGAGAFEVHAVSRRGIGGAGAAWHACDLLDGAACEALVDEVRPTHLLHLAWIAQPGVFWSSPQNAGWLEAGQRLFARFYANQGVRALGVGSCAEYAPSEQPCKEDATPIAPATAYGRAKAALSEALRAAAARRDWIWARVFFPYGPGEPDGRFIPSAIGGLLRGEAVDCTHGRQTRDFIYVDDVARALTALLERGASGAYNVGSGHGATLREVGTLISNELGAPALLRFGARPAPENEPAVLVADTGRIRAAAGWAPRIGLAEGIRRTIAARQISPLRRP